MDHHQYPRPLNPNAPPFYPPPPPPTPTSTATVPYSVTRPVPTGPRTSRLRDLNVRRRPVAAVRSSKFLLPLNPNQHCTSVMLRNIPNNYTRALLLEFLDNHCKLENEKDENNTIHCAFDFVYLPIDFSHRLNVGYAFINFTTSEAACKFNMAVKGKTWDFFKSKKIADVSRARIQGKDALVRNFERMNLLSPSSDYLPVWFEPPRDGCGSSSTLQMHTIGQIKYT